MRSYRKVWKYILIIMKARVFDVGCILNMSIGPSAKTGGKATRMRTPQKQARHAERELKRNKALKNGIDQLGTFMTKQVGRKDAGRTKLDIITWALSWMEGVEARLAANEADMSKMRTEMSLLTMGGRGGGSSACARMDSAAVDYKTAFLASPLPVVIFKADEEIVDFNDLFQHIVGYSRDAMSVASMRRIMGSSAAGQHVFNVVVGALETEPRVRVRVSLVCNGGRRVDSVMHVAVVVRGYFYCIVDVAGAGASVGAVAAVGALF